MSQYHRFIRIGDEIHCAYEHQRAFNSPDELLIASRQNYLEPGTYFVGAVLCTTGSISMYFDGKDVYVPKLEEHLDKYYNFDKKYATCEFFHPRDLIGDVIK